MQPPDNSLGEKQYYEVSNSVEVSCRNDDCESIETVPVSNEWIPRLFPRVAFENLKERHDNVIDKNNCRHKMRTPVHIIGLLRRYKDATILK